MRFPTHMFVYFKSNMAGATTGAGNTDPSRARLQLRFQLGFVDIMLYVLI